MTSSEAHHIVRKISVLIHVGAKEQAALLIFKHANDAQIQSALSMADGYIREWVYWVAPDRTLLSLHFDRHCLTDMEAQEVCILHDRLAYGATY